MLSRTSLSASRVSSRSVATTFVRANSTTTGSQEPATTPAANSSAPKRSIPRAAAFADLLAPKGNSRPAASRAPGVGLSALGDDQFDGLGRFSRLQGFQRNNQDGNFGEQGQQRDAQQSGGFGEGFTSPRQVTIGGVSVQVPNSTRTAPAQRQNDRRDNNRRQDRRDRSQERRTVDAARAGDGRAPTRTSRPPRAPQPERFNKQDQKPKKINAADTVEATQVSSPAPSSAAPLTPRKPRTIKRAESAALAKLFDLRSTDPTVIAPQSPSRFTLVGTPTILEEQAGDYSRYLEPSFINSYAQSPVLGPVDYARLTLAKRPDVTLEKRAEAVKIMSAVVATGGVGAKTTVRA